MSAYKPLNVKPSHCCPALTKGSVGKVSAKMNYLTGWIELG
jgi:hypothetical protein